MKVHFFGTRGSCPCSSDRYQRYGGNTSCVLVEVDGEPPLILDLGTGLRALGESLEPVLRESGRPLVATALLTHLHYDHILGLPFFSPLRVAGAVLDVYGPAQEEGTLKDVLARAVQPPFFPITMDDFHGDLRFHDMDGTDDLAFGGIKVKVRSVPHRGHTLGFRVEADGQAAGLRARPPGAARRADGRTRACWSCAIGADLVIHDAQYSDGEFAAKSDWGHSTDAYAVRVASESGAKRLALFHHDPAHTDGEVDGLLARARELAAPAGAPGRDRRRRGVHGRPVPGVSVTFDVADFKEAMGRFATGVTVVTALEEGVPVGFTCQSFVSLSLDPPLVALAPAKSSTSWPRIARAGSFCVNILADDQQAVCRGMAVSGGDKFAGIEWHGAAQGGAPVIDGCLAWVDCRVELIHDAGDHELVIGRVLDLGLAPGDPTAVLQECVRDPLRGRTRPR